MCDQWIFNVYKKFGFQYLPDFKNCLKLWSNFSWIQNLLQKWANSIDLCSLLKSIRNNLGNLRWSRFIQGMCY